MLLPWAEYWYNIAYHHCGGLTPFEVLVYGRDPQSVKYVPDSKDPILVLDQLITKGCCPW